MLKFAKLFLIALIFSACSQEQPPKPTTPLMVKTANGETRFMVEVANTPEELKTGLMHRTNLGFTSGMIFNIYPVRPIAMWMKNTKIPLDMLFIGPDGSIIMIKENAAPLSEELIICKDPVRAVVEINAGQVKRNNIKVGDKITHMLLNSMLDIKTPGPEPKVISYEKAPEKTQPSPQLQVQPQNKQPVAPKAQPTNTEAPKPATPKASAPVVAPKAPVAAPVVAPKLPVPAPSL